MFAYFFHFFAPVAALSQLFRSSASSNINRYSISFDFTIITVSNEDRKKEREKVNYFHLRLLCISSFLLLLFSSLSSSSLLLLSSSCSFLLFSSASSLLFCSLNSDFRFSNGHFFFFEIFISKKLGSFFLTIEWMSDRFHFRMQNEVSQLKCSGT